MNIDPTTKAEKARQRKMRRRSTAHREEVRRTVGCIQCGALPGEYCKTTNGGRRVTLHAFRYAAAKNGKSAEKSMRPTAPAATHPDLKYAILADADAREIETLRIKKPRRQINPSE